MSPLGNIVYHKQALHYHFTTGNERLAVRGRALRAKQEEPDRMTAQIRGGFDIGVHTIQN